MQNSKWSVELQILMLITESLVWAMLYPEVPSCQSLVWSQHTWQKSSLSFSGTILNLSQNY